MVAKISFGKLNFMYDWIMCFTYEIKSAMSKLKILRHKMNLLSFKENNDKAYDFIDQI